MAKLATAEICQGTPSVFLATPSYDGKVSQVYTISLARSIAALKDAGIGVTYCLLGGNCHVDDARNGLVREFLDTDCTDLVFLDADIGWRACDLVELVRHDALIVGGVYPKKGDTEDYPVYVAPGTVLTPNEAGLVEVEALPTGFLRISRKAILSLLETHGQRKYKGQNWKEGDSIYTILFERTWEDGVRWSGDYAFCRKWIESGGQLFVDPRFYFVHEGSQEWGGSLGDFWRKKHGVEKIEKEIKFKSALNKLRAGTETTEDLVRLVEGWGNEWSAQPELLDAMIQMARQATGPILECGSGLSSLVLGCVTSQPVISLEHDPIWAAYTQKVLEQHGVANVHIQCAPLTDYGPYEWYTPISELPDFTVVVCDGPPRDTKGGRNGLGSVREKVVNAVLLLDDPAGDTMRSLGDELGVTFHILGEYKPYAIGVPGVVVT